MHLSSASLVLLHLSLIEEIGPAVVLSLLEHLGPENLASLYGCSAEYLNQICAIRLPTAQRIVQGIANKKILDEELKLLEHNNIQLITILDSHYPSLLRKIHLPPVVLTIKGSLESGTKGIAVIGSRGAGQYAQSVVATVIPDLVNAGYAIVSGGARGVDTMAHIHALQSGGKTLVVLGSGILRAYPPENYKLFEKVIHNNGALISPFPVTAPPLPGNFPARNRIISGISQGCIVIQAAKESGARITATFALEQGKEVFAIPGSLFDPLSQGCHELIKQGATLVTQSADILLALGHDLPDPMAQKKINASEPISRAVEENLSVEDKIIRWAARPITFDELQINSALSFIELNDILFSLQLQGRIVQTNLGLWQALTLVQ